MMEDDKCLRSDGKELHRFKGLLNGWPSALPRTTHAGAMRKGIGAWSAVMNPSRSLAVELKHDWGMKVSVRHDSGMDAGERLGYMRREGWGRGARAKARNSRAFRSYDSDFQNSESGRHDSGLEPSCLGNNYHAHRGRRPAAALQTAAASLSLNQLFRPRAANLLLTF